MAASTTGLPSDVDAVGFGSDAFDPNRDMDFFPESGNHLHIYSMTLQNDSKNKCGSQIDASTPRICSYFRTKVYYTVGYLLSHKAFYNAV